MFYKKKQRSFFGLLMVVAIFFSSYSLVYSSNGTTGDSDWLQSEIDNAVVGVETTIIIDADIEVKNQVLIPTGKNIVLKDDGAPRTIKIGSTNNSAKMFLIEDGANLTLDTSNQQDSYLVLDGDQKSVGTISESGMIINKGSFILNAGTIKGFKGVFRNQGVVSTIGQDATFVMNGGLVTDNVFEGQYGGIIYVTRGATFTMDGGEISNNSSNFTGAINNGVIYIEAAGVAPAFDQITTFLFNGGLISHNSSHSGTVFLGEPADPDFYSRAKMVMNGGEISDNHAKYTGGGIFVCGQAMFEMNDGLITRNEAVMGAGVSVFDLYTSKGGGANFEYWKTLFPAEFIMNGGEISNNKAMDAVGTGDIGCGGGIYVASDNVILNAGRITDNTASNQGGGVYVGSLPYTLHIYDAIVTENTADILGGGLWFCPTGDAQLSVTSGGAVFKNTALGAGDDYVSVKHSNKTHLTSLSDRILGGGVVDWYQDGAIIASNTHQLGEVDVMVPRYDENNLGVALTDIKDSDIAYALKAMVSENAMKVAKSQAKVIITGNSALRGGGIGSNGEVVIGNPEDPYTLHVTKKWEDTVLEKDKVGITVYLKIGEQQLDSVILNASNQWTATFENLPNPETLDVSLAVVENPVPAGFVVEYGDAVIDKATKTISIEVLNSYAPKVATGDLSIKKTVSGEADTNKEFDFIVKLLDGNADPLTGTYSYSG